MSALLAQIKSSDSPLWQRLLKLSVIFLTLYLCWRLAALFWLVIAPLQSVQVSAVQLGSKQAQIPNITGFALFQKINATENINDQIPLTLQGVLVGSNPQSSSAVIKVNETAERYRVGEQISGTGYQLSEVYWDRIVLRNNSGASRELIFTGLPNGLNEPMVSTQVESPVLSAPVNNTATEAMDSTELHMREATQKLDSNRDQYLQEMGLKTASDGLEITANTPALLRQKLGLQPGDRIISLNGRTMSAGQSEAQLLEQARQQGQAKLEIKRGDQVMTIQQDFR
jgi:general secretion pathway protein C